MVATDHFSPYPHWTDVSSVLLSVNALTMTDSVIWYLQPSHGAQIDQLFQDGIYVARRFSVSPGTISTP